MSGALFCVATWMFPGMPSTIVVTMTMTTKKPKLRLVTPHPNRTASPTENLGAFVGAIID